MMDLSPVTLEGRRVRLEPLSLELLEGLCAVGLDDALWRWTPGRVHTRDEMRAYVQEALSVMAAGRALAFATVDRASGRVVGSTRFANAEPAHRRVEVGWTWLGARWQRTGFNIEAKLLMLRHAFERLGCLRVEFKTDALNLASRRALLGIGATEEGVLRSHMVTADGRVRDSVYYSVLAHEWPEVRANLEQRLARGDPRARIKIEGEPARSSADAPQSSGRISGDDAPGGEPGAGRLGRRALPGGFELDDDRSRIDVAEVHRFLSTASYWAAGRPRATVERLIREATRVVGLYLEDRQVGFARTVSDGMSFAYLADVYVLPEFRGHGLGLELVREAVERSPFASRRWLLHTADAHALYRQVGFGPPGERLMERPAAEGGSP